MKLVLSLDQWGDVLVQSARDLRKQIGDEEYSRVMTFERVMELLRQPVGHLPGGLFFGKVN